MLTPELPTSLPENSSFLTQVTYGIFVAIAAIAWIWRQINEGKKDSATEPPKPVILERAELADMEPVRQMVKKWEETVKRIDAIVDMQADIAETAKATADMKMILDKMARQAEIDEQVERRVREQDAQREKERDRRTTRS